MTATRIAIGLGSNLGDRLAHLRSGLAGLASVGDLVAVSSLYETAPQGGPEQDDYLNAVATLTTAYDPGMVMATLLEIEAVAGRVRDKRFGPRTLDLDLLVYGDLTIDQPDLVVPHPRLHQRRFVLDPLAEVWPDAMVGGRTVADLAKSVTDQSVVVVARYWVR
ncbi:MAG TPA: 2-amino-4-hydroxy-6-hydroxymethyldihydropteridine diphosphokinase [Acidimicrobiia bacterium]